ncbi:sensor histidine kinase [Mucilaginibacter pedocola]|uniref:sensor histidine kinase n=1 Tax=Mucilaginibacter pedocola TaxID=1792845 RepID=UPI00139011ED|nr:HAMP domain-containing sensor histidine kinase [Mucilaginibacter pedocola]
MPCSICKKAAIDTSHNATPLKTQAGDFFGNLFDTKDWPARWHCGNWTDLHGWLYIAADLLIFVSYFAIPILLALVVKRRADLPFMRIIWLFVAFIVLCGCTHLIDAAIFWWPAYRLSAFIRILTGVVSVSTLIALYKVLPDILTLRSVAELKKEIKQREEAEAALNKSHQLLVDSHEQLRSFTHILSHNIRNHASNVALLTDMVDRQGLEEYNADLFDKIAKVSQGLISTVNDVAEAIMIKERHVEPVLITFQEVINDVLKELRTEIDASKVTIEADLQVQSILYPAEYLKSILINLLSNAIKYRRYDVASTVLISTYTDENGSVIMDCADNGIGIDLALHGDKVFGLYKTFHPHKDAHGVGLFLVKTQVESQRGSITVKSKIGEGTTFKVNFNQKART